MPANLSQFQRRARAILAGMAVAVGVTACAPDMYQLGVSTDLDNYLQKINKNCGSQYINNIQVWQLANDDQQAGPAQDAYFYDQTSMLLYGTITPEQYIADMSGYFDDESPRGKRAYQCIISQLPQNEPALPKAYRGVMKAAPQVSGND